MSILTRFEPGSLRFRLIAASILVEVVVLALMIGNSVRLIDNAARASVAAALAQAAPMLNAAATPYLLERDYSGLQDFLIATSGERERELVYVSIVDLDGNEAARVGQPFGTPIAAPSKDIGQAIDEGVYRVSRPIVVGGQRMGEMRLGLSTRIVAETRRSMLRQGLLIAAGEIAASIVILGLIGLWLTRHLERAAAASRAIGDGDYTVRLPEQGGREVGELARAVNRMGTEVAHREQALHELNLELEQRVEQRTASLARVAQEQQTLLDNVIVGIIFVRERKILRCNRGWAEMLGYRIEELEGQPTRIYYASEAAYLAQGEQVYPAIVAGQTASGECEFMRRDGSALFCSFQGKAIDPDDLDRGSIWLIQDISARKAAERALAQRTEALQDSLVQLRETQLQLIQAEKLAALGQLVAGIAHELNTPIGNVVTMASSLAGSMQSLAANQADQQLTRAQFTRTVEQCQLASEVIVRNALRAADLIDKFKLVAADQHQDTRCRFELGAQIRDVVAGMGPALRAAGVAVSVEVEAEVEMDSFPGLLTQVVVGLIGNAIDHAFHGGPGQAIRIRVAPLPPFQAVVTIADNGKGIDEHILPRIFEPFFSTRRGAGHSGLGLHILYNVVTGALEGQIDIASREGEGVVATITLARTVASAAPAAHEDSGPLALF